MQIEKRTMNWLPRPGLWQEAQAQRAARRQQATAAIAERQGLASTFAAVRNNLATGQAEIAARAAGSRLSITA